MLFHTKEAQMERTCAMQERSSQFKISLAKELFVEDFEGMRVFLQESRYVPVPGGAECMICSVAIARDHPLRTKQLITDWKVILVGTAFMKLPHIKKLILLREEELRQKRDVTKDLGHSEGVVHTSLDWEIARRQTLAWEFSPKLVDRTFQWRDRVFRRSMVKASQGIYVNSDDHYKPAKHPIGQGSREYRCYPKERWADHWDGEYPDKPEAVVQVDGGKPEPLGSEA